MGGGIVGSIRTAAILLRQGRCRLLDFYIERCCLFLGGNNWTCNVTGQVQVCAALHSCQPSCCITLVIFHSEEQKEAVTGALQ